MLSESIDSRIRNRLVPFVVVADAICLVGSNVTGDMSPNDVDVLVRWYGPASKLPSTLRRPFKSSKKIQFTTEPAGPHSQYIPLFHFYFVPLQWDGDPSSLSTVTRETQPRIWGDVSVDHLPFTVIPECLYYKLEGGSLIFYCSDDLPEIAFIIKLRKLFPDIDIEVTTKWEEDLIPVGSLVAHPVANPVPVHIPEPHFEPFRNQKRLQEHDAVNLDTFSGLRVDLGCGEDKPSGWVGLDIKEAPGVDIVWDAEKPLPFKDSSIAVIRAHHFLEHISNQDHILREIHRVLSPGGSFIFEVPSTRGEGAFSHPDHHSYYNMYTWLFWTKDHLLEDRPKFDVEVLDEFCRDGGRLWYVSGVLRKPETHELVSEARNDSGIMLAAFLPISVANNITVPDGEPSDKMHVTLFYFGDSSEWSESDIDSIKHLIAEQAKKTDTFTIMLNGTDMFPTKDGTRPFYAKVISERLVAVHEELSNLLKSGKIPYHDEFDYHPHVTIKYLQPDEVVPSIDVNEEFLVSELVLTYQGSQTTFPLGSAVQESQHSRHKCMHCESPPEVEILWAEGMARAWFCQKHFDEFKTNNRGDVDYVRKVPHGVVGKKKFDYSEKSVAESIQPFSKFTPQKPRVSRFTEHFTVDQLWNDWAKERIANGSKLVAEMKLNGFRTIVEKKADRVRISFEKTDVTDRLPDIAQVFRGIPEDFILDGDIGIHRSGKPLPRIAVMTLLSAKPKLLPEDIVVFTAFDTLYITDDLSDRPFLERRDALESFYSRHHLSEHNDLSITEQRGFTTKSQLQRIYDQWGRSVGSEGLVAKMLEAPYSQGGTESISKIKNTVEIKARVLSVTKNKNGTYSFRGGVFPGRGQFQNFFEFNGKRYIGFGNSFNASFYAQPGDIVTFSVEEIIIGMENDKPALQWLGARPMDVDHERTSPYFANQVVELAKRGNILQEYLSEYRPTVVLIYNGTMTSFGGVQDESDVSFI